jgi:2-hydroxychromene-2-carboxylate isomerase
MEPVNQGAGKAAMSGMREEGLNRLEFFFDFGSPTTYLAHTQMPVIAQRTGAEVVYRPMLLGGVFKATGNQSPAFVKAKSKWMDGDLKAFARRYGVPYERNPWFPINTMMLMRGAIAMERENRLPAYADAIFRAIWVEPQNMNDPQTVGAVLAKAGFEPRQSASRCSSDRTGWISWKRRCATPSVMPGLVPGIHALADHQLRKDVDGRDKPGHDDYVVNSAAILPSRPSRAR